MSDILIRNVPDDEELPVRPQAASDAKLCEHRLDARIGEDIPDRN
jgi:hypothetical protein